jgi:uncharacterized protein (TIGR02145 family)
LKATGVVQWNSPNTSATNSSGFTALPAGGRTYDGQYNGPGAHAYFWVSTSRFSSEAWYRDIAYNLNLVYNLSYSKQAGYSVRCIMD